MLERTHTARQNIGIWEVAWKLKAFGQFHAKVNLSELFTEGFSPYGLKVFI